MGAWRVYQIERSARVATASSSNACSRSCCSTSRWVNRKDASGSKSLKGLPGPGQHRRVRPLQPLPTAAAGTVGCDQLDGDVSLTCGDGMELAQTTPRTKISPASSGALRLHRARDGPQGKDKGLDLWDDDDGFFYDCLRFDDGTRFPLKVRSMVGLIPLFAVETLEPEMLDRLPGFKQRLEWFVEHRHDLTDNVACMRTPGDEERRLLSVVTAERLQSVLRYMLDEQEFLSPYGIRALSRYHKDIRIGWASTAASTVWTTSRANRRRACSGQLNWRGPIWFPVNYLLIESLQNSITTSATT